MPTLLLHRSQRLLMLLIALDVPLAWLLSRPMHLEPA